MTDETRATWDSAYINDLPDSSFLYIEPGGTKDDSGKTVPRSLRHFPVKDAQGNVDMPHLRNALSRIPQSSLSQAIKDQCTAKAERMLAAMSRAMSQTMAMPEDQAAMASHLAQMHDMADANDMTLAQMTAQHNSMHAAGADHQHVMVPERALPTSEFEVRGTDLWPDEDMELRSTGDGLSFEGYALKWDRWSQPIPGGPRGPFREKFRDGSMARTLARNPDIVLTAQHNLMTLPLGRTKAGTFRVSADSTGLLTAGDLPDNEIGRPVRDAIRRKDISGMSIRFRVPNERSGAVWASDYSEREIVEAALGPEISIVTFPAYPDTTATVRHLAEAAGVEPDALSAAFRALHDPDARLTGEERDLLLAAIGAKTPPKLAQMRERLASAFAS